MACDLIAYVDESGDEGLNEHAFSSSPWFLNSCVIFPANTQRSPAEIIRSTRVSIGQPETGTIKLTNIEHHSRLAFVDQITRSALVASAVLVHKVSVKKKGAFSEPLLMYRYTIKLLLERISWLARMKNCRCKMIFSIRKGAKREDLDEYIAKLKQKHIRGGWLYNHRIKWDFLEEDYDIEHEAENPGLRIADAVVSAFGYAVNPRHDFTEPRYAIMLKPVMFKHNNNYARYGVKIFPNLESPVLADLPDNMQSEFMLGR